jgi:hypothetical protein
MSLLFYPVHHSPQLTVAPSCFSEGFDRKTITIKSGLYGDSSAMFTIDVNITTGVEEE